MGLRFLNIKDGCDLVSRLAFEKKLVPFFGAGFTANCPSRNGHCPTHQKLNEIFYKLIIKYSDCTIEDLEGISPLSRKVFDTVPFSEVRSLFLDYFTEIQLEPYKIDFLNVVDWPRAYTINVDNAIESNGGFQALVPYYHYKNYVLNRKPVYKLHGDAYTEATSDDCEGVVFRHSYHPNLTAKKNKDFVESLTSDFSNNNFIYVGCNLNDPQTMRNIFEQSNPNQDLHRFIVRNSLPSHEEEENLSAMGITRIILAEDLQLFYTTFVDCYKKFAAS